MPSNKMTVFAPLSAGQRALILENVRPAFSQVWCRGLTWRYDPPEGSTFPEGPLTLVLYGRHVAATHEALTGRVEDHGAVRPDGKAVHVTLSTMAGTPPGAASDIDPDNVSPIAPLRLTVTLSLQKARQMTAERRAP